MSHGLAVKTTVALRGDCEDRWQVRCTRSVTGRGGGFAGGRSGSRPYHSDFFRTLTGRGTNTPEGAMSYVEKSI